MEKLGDLQEKEIIIAIGKEIRKRRMELGHTMESISKLCGISRGMLGLIESGKSTTTITTLWKLASILKIEIKELFPNLKLTKINIIKSAERKKYEFESGKHIIFDTIKNKQEIEFYEVNINFGNYERPKWISSIKNHILIIQSGELSLKINSEWCDLEVGDCISFGGDQLEKLKINKSKNVTIYCVSYSS